MTPSRICRKLLAKPAFRKYAKENHTKGSTVNDSAIGRAFKESEEYKLLEKQIKWANEDYREMPEENRMKAWKNWLT